MEAVSGSAGKNDSMASSETVTSSGVPKVVTVLKKTSSPACVAEAEGHDDVTGSGDLDLRFGFVAGVGA